MRAVWSTIAIVGLASGAYAVDGVLEINHACATATGCFSGDTAGYPVTIDGSAGRSSYRLTGNLVVPDAGTDGIRVSAPNVSIDLNGFEIVRSGCEGATSSCTPAPGSFGSGVEEDLGPDDLGTSLKNGTITGMGFNGVAVGAQAIVTNVRARWNGNVGIVVGSGSVVSGNTAYENGSNGISANTGSVVSGNAAYQNGAHGFSSPGSGTTVSGNASFDNGLDGINASVGNVVSGNTVYSNGEDGIDANQGSLVRDNAVRVNGAFGLNLESSAGYRENVINGNGGGNDNINVTFPAGGVNMGSNSCAGTTTCP